MCPATPDKKGIRDRSYDVAKAYIHGNNLACRVKSYLDMHSHTIIFFFESDFFYANAVLFKDNSVFQTFYVA